METGRGAEGGEQRASCLSTKRRHFLKIPAKEMHTLVRGSVGDVQIRTSREKRVDGGHGIRKKLNQRNI